MAKKRILILGATGSIGKRTLDVIRDFPDDFTVVGLTTYGNVQELFGHVKEFVPEVVCVVDENRAEEWESLAEGRSVATKYGEGSLTDIVKEYDFDVVVVATVGAVGLLPTLRAIEKSSIIALANKEVLVMAGDLVMRAARDKDATILPIDSEHNAIFQCLMGNLTEDVRRILLTASGGPFRTSTLDEIKAARSHHALNHPTWSMGRKITVDSSTLMNKGFEVIECCHLFGVGADIVEVIIHPQSVVHSMVEFVDGSIIAQMGRTDMYLPIQNVLFYPRRVKTPLEQLDFSTLGELTFQKPDVERFPCLGYAYEAVRVGGTMPAVVNAANEIAVELFLEDRMGFFDIPATIRSVMDKHTVSDKPTLEQILQVDQWARKQALRFFEESQKGI